MAAPFVPSVNSAAVPTPALPPLGLGIGWRPELGLAIDRRAGLGFVELVAEDFFSPRPFPLLLQRLLRRGTAVVPHGLGLSLGSTTPPEPAALKSLAHLAHRVHAPLVSEHIAFVRADGIETGHLLPVPRTRAMLSVLVDNVRRAQEALPCPLALENIASLVQWPDAEMDEADFLAGLLDRTGALLLLDIENVYANARNHAFDAARFLDRLPLHRLAYVHVAGGIEREGIYHDTHTHAVPPGVLELLAELAKRVTIPGVMLERDDDFPSPTFGAGAEAVDAEPNTTAGIDAERPTVAGLYAELDAIAASARIAWPLAGSPPRPAGATHAR